MDAILEGDTSRFHAAMDGRGLDPSLKWDNKSVEMINALAKR